nr:calcineurin-like metallo-phosphoesterase superfamily protein [Tanacetum cinerariifolium]
MIAMVKTLLLLLLFTVTSASSAPELVSRIAFGSCANQSSPQPIWDAILEYKPHVFIWLGDNIYGDIRRPFKLFGNDRTIGPWKNVPRFVPSSYDQMKSKYDIAKTNHGYARLRTIANVIGTWDDHDYGLNDAGKEFKHKDINQKLMLDFLDEPPNSPRRQQAGVYASYTFGPEGRRIKVISNLSACTGPLFYMESWGRFPSERKRLFRMISDSKRDGVFFISGDVHFGEITRIDCATGYPLYDITASGLTQAVEKVIPSFLHFVVRFLAWITPTTMRVINNNCKHKSCTYDLQAKKGGFNNVNGGKQHCFLEVDLPWLLRHRLAILFSLFVAVLIVLQVGVLYVAISLMVKCLRKCKVD